jgi:hypothetical protein
VECRRQVAVDLLAALGGEIPGRPGIVRRGLARGPLVGDRRRRQLNGVFEVVRLVEVVRRKVCVTGRVRPVNLSTAASARKDPHRGGEALG